MPETFRYDVFISYGVKDKPVARNLALRLMAEGLRVWFEEWEMRPGGKLDSEIDWGLEQSRTLVLLMSANASESEWVTFESQAVRFNDPANQRRRFIPLLLDDVEIKGTLKQFAYGDWRRAADEEYERLVAGCRPLVDEAETSGEPDEFGQEFPVRVLRGHVGSVNSVALAADGQLAVSGSDDGTMRVWNIKSGECISTLGAGEVRRVTVTPDGRFAASISAGRAGSARLWDLDSGKCTITLLNRSAYFANYFRAVMTVPKRMLAVSASGDSSGPYQIWDLTSGNIIAYLEENIGDLLEIGVIQDTLLVISTASDFTIRVWDEFPLRSLAVLWGHSAAVTSVVVRQDGKFAISGSVDNTVRVWDLSASKCLAILEGHSASVRALAVTPDGSRVVSGSDDKTVRVWDPVTGECLSILRGHADGVQGVAVAADGKSVVSCSKDGTLRVWDLSRKLVVQERPPARDMNAVTTRYTNAKVLLMGETGVGKTGLAYRLTEDRFVSTISTDGVWATQLKLPHDTSSADTEREIWLWDFAGQADYRLIHQLFLDETALAVLVFNPQSENPFEGLGQWDHDLQRAARRQLTKLLVAGRCDRGGLMVSRESVENFRRERRFTQFLETSAYTGHGCVELRDAIVRNIPWEDIPWTASPRIFKLLKEEIVKLKDEGKVLLRMGELKQQLEMRLPGENFTLEHLQAVVRLLAGPGVVWELEFGKFVLLQPARINSYAAAAIRKVRAHMEEIGVILEEDVLAGRLDYQDMNRLPHDEEQIVLRAMHQTFVDYGLCMREPTEAGTLLVFPSLFKRERPELAGHPAVFVTYQFSGQLDEIYSTLVVRLHHTSMFRKDQLWRFAADFQTESGKRVGLKMTKLGEGAGEIAVYFDQGVADDTMVTFIRYIHEHLQTKAQGVLRLRQYVCPHCHTPVENRMTAWKRLQEGKKDIICVDCEKRVPLWDLIEMKFASEEFQQSVRALEEEARANIDNESRELILVGHAFAVAGEAGQIFRPTPNSDWGIDGELEFKNDKGEASGRRVYLQLKSGDSYLQTRKADGKEVFRIKLPRHAGYWLAQAYPVMLVIRTSDGQIRWMNVTDYLERHGPKTRQMVFEGEPFTALSVLSLRDKLLR